MGAIVGLGMRLRLDLPIDDLGYVPARIVDAESRAVLAQPFTIEPPLERERDGAAFSVGGGPAA
jgi:hypothetical protein